MENPSENIRLLEDLPTMGRPRLVAEWKIQFGASPSPKLRVEMMRPAIAYRIQERAAGLSGGRIRRTIEATQRVSNASCFKAGTRIVREWNGKIHEVTVTADGYEYEGERYKRLSPIAGRITGTKWSGPAFFGTKPKGRVK